MPKGWLFRLCGHQNYSYMPLRCRHCVGCKIWKGRQLVARLLIPTLAGQNIKMLTLTSLPGTTWVTMMKNWQRLKQRLERRYGKMMYAAVKEEGFRTGMKHLHVLMADQSWMAQPLISAMWGQLSGAPVVDIRLVRAGVHQGSLQFYLAKQGAVERKSVTFSASWPKLPKLSDTLQTTLSLNPPSDTSKYSLLADGSYARFPHGSCPCHGLVISPARIPLPLPAAAASLQFPLFEPPASP